MTSRPRLVRAYSQQQLATMEDRPWAIVGLSMIARDSGLVTASAYTTDMASRRLVHTRLVDRQLIENTRRGLAVALTEAATEFAMDLRGESPLR